MSLASSSSSSSSCVSCQHAQNLAPQSLHNHTGFETFVLVPCPQCHHRHAVDMLCVCCPAACCSCSCKPPACPKAPGPDDCCQKGCKVCVWDIYRDKMNAYRAYMQQHHPGVPLPDVEEQQQQQQMMDASMDAFERLERQLLQQQQQRQQLQQQ